MLLFEKEKLDSIKKSFEQIVDFVEEVEASAESLSRYIKESEKDKNYYMQEYKRVCDEKHKLEAELMALKNSKEGQG